MKNQLKKKMMIYHMMITLLSVIPELNNGRSTVRKRLKEKAEI
jgi:hypothetical protein